MNECENVPKCRFFNEVLQDAPSVIVEGYKQQYCRMDNSKCARRVLSQRLGSENVPVDLGPHEATRAITLLRQHGHGEAAAALL